MKRELKHSLPLNVTLLCILQEFSSQDMCRKKYIYKGKVAIKMHVLVRIIQCWTVLEDLFCKDLCTAKLHTKICISGESHTKMLMDFHEDFPLPKENANGGEELNLMGK